MKEIFEIIIKIIKSFLNGKKVSKVVNKFKKDRWYIPELKRDLEKARNEFAENIDSYRAGKIAWKSGFINNKKYNMVSLQRRNKKYFRVSMLFEKTENNTRTVLTHIGTKEVKKTDYDKFKGSKETWCNQVLSIGSFHTTSIDFDWFSEREFNANRICENLEKGFYDSEAHRFTETTKPESNEIASKGGFSFVTLYKPRGTGHVSILNNTKKLTVWGAGGSTGLNMSLEQSFKSYNLPHLKYWYLEKFGKGKAV